MNPNAEDTLVCGDFNLCMLRMHEDAASASFYHSMQALSLVPTISKPTRITDNSSTLIDNIFATNLNNFSSGAFVVDISDHLPIFIIYKNFFQPQQSQAPHSFKYRKITDATLSDLHFALSRDALWEILDEDNVDIAIELLHNKILSNFNNCCPIKTKFISPKDALKPWINYRVKQEIRKKENLYKLFLRKLVTPREYNFVKNQVTNKIRRAKREYYENLFETLKLNMKKTWSTINNIISPQLDKKVEIKNIIFNDTTYTEGFDIANIFNHHFSTIGQTIDQSIPAPNNNSNIPDYLSNVSFRDSFFFNPVTCITIEKIISNLKNKTAHVSTYPISVIKYLSSLISPILCSIFNKSISAGCFPQSLKSARVVPVYKSGPKSNVNNYRPISILPIFSKIFEKIVHFQLYNYLEKLKILSPNQYGFRKKMSTSDAMTNMLQFIYDNLDRGHEVISLFLDFSKAFDCVNHQILLRKLHVYGIRGIALDWFRSYLSNRIQYTTVNGEASNSQPINYGVPQGSVLGPLLFLIFINDLPKCSNLFKFTLFADDSTLSCNFDNAPLDLIFNTIETELVKVNNWLINNRIKINIDKSKFICFSYRKPVLARPVKLGDSFIYETDQIKFLGLVLDKHLKFINHIDHIQSKMSRSVGVLFKLNSFLPTSILKLLYNSLILPYLNYGVECWHAAPNYSLEKLHVLQKKAIRAIFNQPYNAHTNGYFKNNGLLKLKDIYRLNLCTHMYKITESPANYDISLQPRTLSSIHSYNTRNSNNIATPRCNRTTTQSSFLYQSAREWNILPQQIKGSKTSSSFKYALRQYYCSLY